MLLAVGSEILSLMRVKIGPLTLRGLKLGQKRLLTAKELQELHFMIEGARNK